jgi:hypothetical protein
MGPENKGQELRALLGLAIKLRNFVASSHCEDADLFLSAAEALESRAHRRAYNLTDEREKLYSAEA